MKPIFTITMLAMAVAASLAACGGGGSGDSGSDRGSLREAPVTLGVVTAAQIDAMNAGVPPSAQALVGKAKCDVKVVALDYNTAGALNGDVANASAVLLVPAGACASNTAPLMAFARDIELKKNATLATLDPGQDKTYILIALFASQGYAVVATDYLGYAKSTYPFHPFLHADSEAGSVLDSVRAARKAAPQVGAKLSDKLFVAGYAQGGHASAAAQRASQGSDLNVTAGAHSAGYYNLSGSLQVPDAVEDYAFFMPFLVSSYQKIYGNVYSKPSDIYKAPYDSYIEALLPSPTFDEETLVSSGRLPSNNVPDQARDALFKPAFLTDIRTNPNSALAIDARKNDLLGWTPTAPVLLCGAAADKTVPPSVHQAVLKADFDKRGVKNVTSIDVDAQIQQVFGTNGVAPAPDSEDGRTYYPSYHSGNELALCLIRTRMFFDGYK